MVDQQDGGDAGDALQVERYTPHDYHQELAYAIKAVPTSSRRMGGPEVRAEMPFDMLVYNGGLK